MPYTIDYIYSKTAILNDGTIDNAPVGLIGKNYNALRNIK